MRRLAQRAEPELLAHLLPERGQERARASRSSTPRPQVYVLYRDIRTYGLLEEYYTRGAQAGRASSSASSPTTPPAGRNRGDGRRRARSRTTSCSATLEVDADLLVLSAGMRPSDTGGAVRASSSSPAPRRASSWRPT
ncbi:MAG: hypothetical protein MZV70_44740 [Desulfobacterales bacterium]|nr:hypothetical protein [Desulfobacterales bacterium]